MSNGLFSLLFYKVSGSIAFQWQLAEGVALQEYVTAASFLLVCWQLHLFFMSE
jgi:hypothetical protein